MDSDSCFLDSFAASKQETLWQFFEKLPSPRVYAKNQMIYRQGETAEHFYYIKKGQAKIFLSSENGMEKALAILPPKSILGEAAFFDRLPRVSSAKALVQSEIVVVSRPALMEYFRQQPALAMSMLQVLSHRVRMLSAQVDNMTFLQADRRIAQLLVKLCTVSDTGERQICCTHEELGSLAGTSRITVSKILNRFAESGWISTQYRTISVKDWAALYRFAGDSGNETV